MAKPTEKTKDQLIIIKLATIISILLLIVAVAGAAFIGGYALAFSRTANLYSETTLLKARAVELEEQILHLKNYAVLIDAMTTQGQAAEELWNLPTHLSPPLPETVYVTRPDSTPMGLGGSP